MPTISATFSSKWFYWNEIYSFKSIVIIMMISNIIYWGLLKTIANRDNMVDYANEVECFYMFRYFDKNNDGYLDYDE
jgi:hypothetical protein